MVVSPSTCVLFGENSSNGHPYSFSSIINGFDPQLFPHSAWPGIYQYLLSSAAPIHGLPSLNITNAYMPLSSQVYFPAFPSIEPLDIARPPAADICLIARDDWETHSFFLDATLDRYPLVFVDKPLTLSHHHLQDLLPFLHTGHVRTGSSLPYDPCTYDLKTFIQSSPGPFTLNLITSARADRYLIHFFELILTLFPDLSEKWTSSSIIRHRSTHEVDINYQTKQLNILISCSRKNPPGLHATIISSSDDRLDITYSNNFISFRTLLSSLTAPPNPKDVYRSINSLELTIATFG